MDDSAVEAWIVIFIESLAIQSPFNPVKLLLVNSVLVGRFDLPRSEGLAITWRFRCIVTNSFSVETEKERKF